MVHNVIRVYPDLLAKRRHSSTSRLPTPLPRADGSTSSRRSCAVSAAVHPVVPFNIFEFYRGQHTYVGIDTLALSSTATGAVLRELVPGFASGHLKPFPVKANAIYPLEQAKAAFVAVAGSSRDRVILRPAKASQ